MSGDGVTFGGNREILWYAGGLSEVHATVLALFLPACFSNRARCFGTRKQVTCLIECRPLPAPHQLKVQNYHRCARGLDFFSFAVLLNAVATLLSHQLSTYLASQGLNIDLRQARHISGRFRIFVLL